MASDYWVGGTNSWNATATGKWAAVSGGSPSYAVNPTAADDVFFNEKPAPNWAASTAYVLGVIRCPNTGNGFFYEVTTAGTTAATEPVWPTTVGATVVNGTVTWTCRASTVTLATAQTVGTINFTGFTGTFTFAANLFAGSTTLGASTTYTSSTGLPTTYTFTTRNANSTFTANGKILPTNLSINLNGFTLTFAGNADFGGNLDTTTTAHTIKAAATTTVDLRIGGNIATRFTNINAAEYVTIKGYGSSKTCATSTSTTNLRLTFVSGSSYTSIAGANGCGGTSFLTVEAGGNFTSNNTNHTFSSAGTVTLSGFNSSTNSSFYALLASVSGNTIILSNDTVIKSSITTSPIVTTISSTGSAKLLLEGNLVLSGGANFIIDKLEFSGSTASNVTGSSVTLSNLQIKEFSINKTGGGSVNFNTNGNFTLFIPALNTYSWTHTAGTVTQGSNCTIRIWLNTVATSIFNYSAPSPSMFTFRDIEFYGAGVTNLNTKLNATKISITPTGTMSISSSGLFGFDTESLFVVNTTTGGRVVTLKSGVTYNITALLIMVNTGGSFLTLNASTSPTKAKFYLGLSAIQEVSNVNPTDIDSHGANNIGPPIFQTIYSQNGVITASTWNWSIGNAPPPIAAKVTVGYTFVN